MQKLSLRDIYLDESYYSGSQAEPISLAEAKSWLYVESAFTDDDALISSLITYSRNAAETFCNISIQNKIVTATFFYNSNEGPYKKDPNQGFFNYPGTYSDNWLQLPYGPVKYVFTVTGLDNATIKTMVQDQDYFVQGTNMKHIRFATVYPTLIIVYQVGWPVIPGRLKEAILNEIAFRYENRGDNTNRYAAQNVGLCEAAEYLAKDFVEISW